ncbi:hypothetical protein [Caldifermentibacillus hisashii]|jgi:hypothetical protein|uniref:hypothetical protein n=1 Tax=Caldifermentibacillus hisashii TaxID=996558 RepID=UPI0033690C20
MEFLKKLFVKKGTNNKQETVPSASSKKQEFLAVDLDWETIPGFIDIEKNEYKLPAIISASIAAGDQPNSTFKIKRILKRNPEAHLVSLIATSLAASCYPESSFVIKSIKRHMT